MFIDTHAHLNFKAFDLDYIEVINRANSAGVGVILNVGSNYKTSLKAIEIADSFENVYAAVSLHPIHVKDEEFHEEKFLKLVKHKKVVAIGETGLDYYYDKSQSNLQKEIFKNFLKISQIISKPVIIHSREASSDLLPILMAEQEVRGVMHCFQEDWQCAQVILGLGMYISFTGLITFGKSEKTLEVLREIPLERVLIETDCPYLTPVPYRGRRNEPAYVVEVARKIAEIKKIPLEKVEAQTTKNAQELFKLTL